LTEPLAPKYVNLKSGNEAVVIYAYDDVVRVKYLRNEIQASYRKEYFEKAFNPVTEDK
jgi:hypothetical protein